MNTAVLGIDWKCTNLVDLRLQVQSHLQGPSALQQFLKASHLQLRLRYPVRPFPRVLRVHLRHLVQLGYHLAGGTMDATQKV